MDAGADRIAALTARLQAALQRAATAQAGTVAAGDAAAARIQALEAEVAELERQVADLEVARTADAEAWARKEADHRAAIRAMTGRLEAAETAAAEAAAQREAEDAARDIGEAEVEIARQAELANSFRRQRDRARRRIETQRVELLDLQAAREADAAQLKMLLDALAPELEDSDARA